MSINYKETKYLQPGLGDVILKDGRAGHFGLPFFYDFDLEGKCIVKLKKMILILAGNALYALAVALFILPNHLITGGTTGLALVAQSLWGMPIAVFVGGFNLVMFVLGLCMLGKSFALTTAVSTFFYPLMLGRFQVLGGNIPLTQDRMLATVLAGLLIGVAIGMVIRAGASTGGMDIPPLVLYRKFRLPVSFMMYLFDLCILIGQMLIFETESILYGLLLVVIYTLVLDRVLVIGTSQIQVKIISENYEAINQAILTKLDRGTTLFAMEGGHLRKAAYGILAVIPGRELNRLNAMVLELDPDAFLIINQVNEVRGRGFTLQKEYKGK